MGSTHARTKPSDDALETFSLVWLDASINQSQENLDTQHNLREIIHQLKILDDCDKCEQYISSRRETDRIILIISGRLGQELVPRIHSLQQLSSVYIYCHNRTTNKEWARSYPKVKAVVTDLTELTARIQSDHVKRRKNEVYESFPISIFDSSINHQKLTIDLQGNLVHAQLLINTLLRMESNSNDKSQLISLCEHKYKDNKKEMKNIHEFKKQYSSNRAIWWYTSDSFITGMLNRALRTQNLDVLFLFHFFIADIQQQLGQLRFCLPVTVYRSELMPLDEIKILQNFTRKFISVNSFLLTIRSRKKALSSLEDSDDLERVLFEIHATPGLDGVKPFANIKSASCNEKDEILFMLGSIFWICNISQQNDRLWIIQLELCTDTNQQFDSVNGGKTLFSFGHVLMTTGKTDEAEIYYQRSLKDLKEGHPDAARCYQELGTIADEKGDLDLSLKYFSQSLEMNSKISSTNNPHIASNYNSIGDIYQKTGDYIKAHESYQQALAIWDGVPPGKNRLKEAVCYNNIGIVYQDQQKYKEALKYYEKAYDIRKTEFASDQISLGISCNNIGSAYYFLNRCPEALDRYEEALQFYEKSLPPKHPKVASTYNNMGAIHEKIDDLRKALSFYEDALKIYRHIFPETHPNMIKIEGNIQRISPKIKKETDSF